MARAASSLALEARARRGVPHQFITIKKYNVMIPDWIMMSTPLPFWPGHLYPSSQLNQRKSRNGLFESPRPRQRPRRKADLNERETLRRRIPQSSSPRKGDAKLTKSPFNLLSSADGTQESSVSYFTAKCKAI